MISLEPSNSGVGGTFGAPNDENNGFSFYNQAARSQNGFYSPSYGGNARSYGNWGTMDGNQEKVGSQTENKGLLHSGLSAVADGASKVFSSASNAVSSATNGPPLQTSGSFSETLTSLNSQTIMVSGCLFGVGMLFMFLAFLTLPLLVFAPSKFAFFFTLGSGCCFASLAYLKGVIAFLKHLMEPTKLPFTIAYACSLVVTLYSTLFLQSYILTLIFSIMQMVSLVSFLLSYIPGGPGMLKFVGSAALQMAKRACDFSDKSTPLPL